RPVPAFGQFERREVDVLDIEDVHFATGRWILLPVETETPPPEDDWGLGGLDVLAAALKHADDHPRREMLVTGHTDAPGQRASNLTLSAKRANHVFFTLGGYIYREEWVNLAASSQTAEELRVILRWIDSRFAYDC